MTVAIVVHSDVADEVHVHGYDLHQDVGAGGTARIDFTADIAGVFEAELENRKLQIVELTVRVTWMLAHGIGGIRDLPVPRYVFYYGAAGVLVVSFAALAFLWRKPVLAERAAGRPLPAALQRVARCPTALRGAVGALSFALLVFLWLGALVGKERQRRQLHSHRSSTSTSGSACRWPSSCSATSGRC